MTEDTVLQSSNSIPENIEARLSSIEALLSSQPANAEAEAKALLEEAPGQEMAMLFLGIARRLQSRFAEATEVLQDLADKCPDAPLVHLQLGLAQAEDKRTEAAEHTLRRAIEIKPDFADAWLALADLLTSANKQQEAHEAFSHYVVHAESSPHLQQVKTAIAQGHYKEAENFLRTYLQQQGSDVVAICILAELSENAGRINEAEAYFRECLALAPGYGRARHNYAVVLLRKNRAAAALAEIKTLLAADPHNLDAKKLAVAVHVRLRQYQPAIELCEDILETNPNEPATWTSLGHVLKTVGRRDDAIDAYRRAINQAPQYGEPWWSLANLKNFQFEDEELQALRGMGDKELPVTDLVNIQFATARALENRGQFEDSFRFYEAANRLRVENFPYDSSAMSKHVSRSLRYFSAEQLEALSKQGFEAKDPIFIVGLPRSGSTLVEQILASHSQVEGTMELIDIPGIAGFLNNWSTSNGGLGYPEALSEVEVSALREMGESYIRQTREQRQLDRPYFIDKLPNNCEHVGLIHLVLPNARIIDVRRHPMACSFSVFKEHFSSGQNFAYRLEDIARYYRDYVTLMAHFDEVLPGRIHRIMYENLVEDTEKEVRALLKYCGLDFEEQCLEFYNNQRAVSTASSEQVRTPIYREGLDHWRNYESWLAPLRSELDELVESYESRLH